MKKLFKDYNIFGGYKSLIRFFQYAQLNFTKIENKKLTKLYNEFEEKINNNEMHVRKDFINFQLYCLSK